MILLIAITLCALPQFGIEATIDITFNDIDIVSIDPEYFDAENTDVHIDEIQFDEPRMVSNIIIVKQLPEDTTARLDVMGLTMGQYRIPTGLRIEMPLCEMLNEQVIVGPLVRTFGFTKEACPPPPGTYAQDGYAPSMDLMPDTFIENKYRAIFEMKTGKKVIVSINIDMDITV